MANSNTSAAAEAAKKGVGYLFQATKSTINAVASGVQKARKQYASKHESDTLKELQTKGSPAENMFWALKRVYYLYMAGYKHELAAAAQQTAKRLTEGERCSVPLDAVIVVSNVLCEECQQHGDFEKGKFSQSMTDFLNKTRQAKDHFDRDTLTHDVYYATLNFAETYGTDWQEMEQALRESVMRLLEFVNNPVDEAASAELRTKAAKAIYRYASAIKFATQESEQKRQKQLRDAEVTMKKEQERQQARGSARGHRFY